MEGSRGIEPRNSGFADRTQQTQLGILPINGADRRNRTSDLCSQNICVTTTPYPHLVREIGIEPTQPYDNRFTVCPNSPTLAFPHI